MFSKQEQSGYTQDIISVECNFEEFPFTCVGLKNLSSMKEYYYERWIKDLSTKKAIKQEWRMIAAPNDHLPGPFDLDVKRALDKIVFNTGIENVVQNKKISFTIYEIAEILQLPVGGSIYNHIRQSLKRLHTTRYESKNAFFLKSRRVYVDDSFYIIERLNLKEVSNDSSARAHVTVYFGSYYLESLKAFYTKPLDFAFYLSLENPIPKRLYGILDKRSFTSKKIVYDLVELAKVIPLSSHTPSKVKERLSPSLAELKDRGFISEYNFFQEGKTKKIEIIVSNTASPSKFTPEEEFFISEIMETLGEHPTSRNYYEKICRTVDRNLIYRAISEVKEEQTFGKIKKSKGALFVAKIQQYISEIGE
ncbi:MAG: replication initiator protein A [Candidatus Manganitrophaceae bacterium]